jgi:hypothetical protein
MGLDPLGSPSIDLSDKAAKSRMALGVTFGLANIFLNNGKGSASMSVDPSGSPKIEFADANGFEMDLGGTGKVNGRTGATEQTSAASIVMFGNDKEHHVIWQAP